MTTAPYERSGPAESIAGLLASLSIATSCIGIAYRPLRVIPLAILLALIAVGIGGRHARLAAAAAGIGALAFALGMAVAVVTSHPLW